MSDPPKLNLYYASPGANSVPFIAWHGAFSLAGFFWASTTPCACGHLNGATLFGTLPAAFFAWWGFSERQSRIGRWIYVPLVALATYAITKNLLDIGWYGHRPLFK